MLKSKNRKRGRKHSRKRGRKHKSRVKIRKSCKIGEQIINPKTGRCIKIGGPTWKKLQKSKVTCKTGKQIINPKTGRCIKIGGPTWKKLQKSKVSRKVSRRKSKVSRKVSRRKSKIKKEEELEEIDIQEEIKIEKEFYKLANEQLEYVGEYIDGEIYTKEDFGEDLIMMVSDLELPYMPSLIPIGIKLFHTTKGKIMYDPDFKEWSDRVRNEFLDVKLKKYLD
uniref:2-cysteine adaptor domain-containing protein n=1 Tax=Iridovirus LCIVAC01 TaxID=2506607 RepID=A0A481YQQ0_9VIRU|nr:MAG: hypothetical protein LCIVAC01_02080 [Iridovirus LCIVAC01]